MSAAPIILVPGFWLGAWAWDEVAAALRAEGHDVTALTLPGLESADADRSAITLSDHVDAICAARRRPRTAPVVLAVHSGTGFAGYAASDRDPRADRGHGLRRLRPREGGDGPGLRGRRAAAAFAGAARGGGEPRRAQRGAARDVPAAGGARAGRRPPRGGRADERRAPRHPEHGHLHGVPVRAGQGRRQSRATPGSPASRSCATSPGSTCRRATGRCGRARRSSPRSSATSRKRTPPPPSARRRGDTAGPDRDAHRRRPASRRGRAGDRRVSGEGAGDARPRAVRRPLRVARRCRRARRSARRRAARCHGPAPLQRRPPWPDPGPTAARGDPGRDRGAPGDDARGRGDPRPHAPQVRGSGHGVRLDGVHQLDGRLLVAPGERRRHRGLPRDRVRLRARVPAAVGDRPRREDRRGRSPPRARRRHPRSAVVLPGARRRPLASRREAHRQGEGAGTDRIAGAHVRPDPRDSRRGRGRVALRRRGR